MAWALMAEGGLKMISNLLERKFYDNCYNVGLEVQHVLLSRDNQSLLRINHGLISIIYGLLCPIFVFLNNIVMVACSETMKYNNTSLSLGLVNGNE